MRCRGQGRPSVGGVRGGVRSLYTAARWVGVEEFVVGEVDCSVTVGLCDVMKTLVRLSEHDGREVSAEGGGGFI